MANGKENEYRIDETNAKWLTIRIRIRMENGMENIMLKYRLISAAFILFYVTLDNIARDEFPGKKKSK